ncbi:hypothetical protein A2U01_0006442 [Trifolium medium]|uniref:Uncharacterized protein n=1 Tax=Trifolium medium TaxID=97028 RepID=A0A392MH85_9FABA|nr:hypothetical protein [Trifolium medium]
MRRINKVKVLSKTLQEESRATSDSEEKVLKQKTSSEQLAHRTDIFVLLLKNVNIIDLLQAFCPYCIKCT